MTGVFFKKNQWFMSLALIGIIVLSLIIVISYNKSPSIRVKPAYVIEKELEIEEGVKTWIKAFEKYGDQVIHSIRQTQDGGYIAVGILGRNGIESSTGRQAPDAYLLKLDSDGNEVWGKNIGVKSGSGSIAQDVQQTSDGGYIIVGMTVAYLRLDTSWDVYLVKTDENGNKIWENGFYLFKAGPENDWAYSVQQTFDGGYIVGGTTNAFFGTTNAFPPNAEAFLLKIDKYGNKTWEKNYGGDGMEDVRSAQQTSDGGYIMAGTTWSYNQTKLEDTQVYLVKTDADGNKMWERVIDAFDKHEQDGISSIQQTSDGGYIMAGNTICDIVSNSGCSYLLKVDKDGNKIWENSYENCEASFLHHVQQTSDGYIAVGNAGGEECVGRHSSGVNLLKIDKNGNKMWEKNFGWYNAANETGEPDKGVSVRGYSVQQTSDGGYVIAGEAHISSSPPWQNEIFLIKTDRNGNVYGYKE